MIPRQLSCWADTAAAVSISHVRNWLFSTGGRRPAAWPFWREFSRQHCSWQLSSRHCLQWLGQLSLLPSVGRAWSLDGYRIRKYRRNKDIKVAI